MEPFRKAGRFMQHETIGSAAGFDIKGKRCVNYASEFKQTVHPHLFPERVGINLRPRRPGLLLEAKKLSTVLEQQAEEQQITKKLEYATDDSFCYPIVVARLGKKAGIRASEIDGDNDDPLETFCDIIQFDDLVLDMDAKSWETKRFVGDRFSICLDKIDAETCPFGLNDPSEQDPNLPPTMTREEAFAEISGLESNNIDRGSRDEDERKIVQKGDQHKPSGMVDLWHVSIYYGGDVFIAYVADREEQPPKFIHFAKHIGPKLGPYRALKVLEVRGHILGMPSLALVMDLHDAAVKMGNRLVQQLLKLRRLAFYRPTKSDVALKVKRSQEDDMIATDDPKSVTFGEYGGVSKDFYQGIDFLSNQFNSQSGNVQLLSGSNELADTAAQSSMLQGNTMARVRKMSERVRVFASELMQDIAFYTIFDDTKRAPMVQMDKDGLPARRHMPPYTVDVDVAPGVTLPVSVNPAELRGDLLSFNYDIEAFADVNADPAMVRAGVEAFLAQYIQYLPFIMQGAIRQEWMAEIGRAVYKVPNPEDALGDMTGAMTMMAQAAAGGVPALPGPTAQVAPPQPQRIPGRGAMPANTTQARNRPQTGQRMGAMI